MAVQVQITTGARLHFGLLAHGRQVAREFGGAGLMIDQPGYVLNAAPAAQDEIVAAPEFATQLQQFVTNYRARCPADNRPPPARLELLRAIPRHMGLGSGTQLGMAVGSALARLAGDEPGPAELARRVGRGLRSALGIHGFGLGGLLVEGGQRPGDTLGTLIARHAFPAHWRFVLIRPPQAEGLSGSAEVQSFAQLAPMPRSTTERLCALLVLELLPAVVDADFETCGEALYEFGRLVGEYFAPAQGGVYADPGMALLVDHLRARGVRGVGQSSWGPTLFALCPDAATADDLIRDLSADSRWSDCHFLQAAPLNHGATIELQPGPASEWAAG